MGDAQMNQSLPAREKGSFFLRWFLAALACSILFHLLFLRKAERWPVLNFSPESYDQIVPRTFRMKRVEIDTKTLEEPATKPVDKKERPPVVLEKEKPLVGQEGPVVTKEILSRPTETLLREKPVAIVTDFSALLNDASPGRAVKTLSANDFRDMGSVLPESLETNSTLVGASGTGGGMPRFSSLDDLLAGGSKVTPATAPMLMPTDLLFEYDSATLKPEAAASLTKLGTIISRNGNFSFRIEGNTDSFGSDEYNNGLSLRRAEEVRRWLQTTMGISSERITTAGLGKSHLLAPSTGDVVAQQLNRRVEIVISAPQP